MERPQNLSFRSDLRLMIFRPCGILNQELIDTTIAFLEEEEERAQHPFNRFSDLSKLDAIDLEFGYVFRVALHRRLIYAGRPPVKSAFYAPNKATERIVRIPALVTDDSPLQIKIFNEISKAAEWLGVSPEDLEEKASLG